MSWTNGKPLGVPFLDRVKRLALLKRRHRVWLRQQAAGEAPLEDESTAGDIIESMFE
jgi:hypothetical protein